MEKQATIRDVARLAGVSLATVSRVLNDADYPVSAQLRQRVRDAMDRLGYVPNAMARSLRRDISRDIGLVIPNISNQFYLQTLLGINDVLGKKDYHLILCNTMRDPAQERKYLRQLFERKVRGIILSSVDENADIVEEYVKKGMKFVLLDQKITGMESTSINFDSRAGARMATEYLLSLGHSRIAFATLPMTRWTRSEMHMGYRNALVVAGVPYDPGIVYEQMPEAVAPYADLELEAGKIIAESFLKDGCPATAILCINDALAIGLIKTLRKHGVRVPEDVSVFGFDDIPIAGTFEPSLTTVHYPAIETGRLAAMMLMDNLESGAADSPVSMQLTPTLVIRDTVAPPAKK